MDHSHWWMFMFSTEPRLFYFTELPCGTERGDPAVGAEIGRIVDENREAFGGMRGGAGRCRPREVPEEFGEVPESLQRRLLTREEIKSIFDAKGLMA